MPRVSPLASRLAAAGIAVLAAAALFWPRGDGAEAPGGFLIDRQGRPAPLAERLEPHTLLHFWATWCAPCIEEIPAIQRLAADYRERPGFRVLLVAVEDDPRAVDVFLGAASAAALFDPNWSVARRFETKTLPSTYLLRDGEAVEAWREPMRWDDPEVRARLDALLVRTAG
ncbi:MAG TPA: TlpA disulfide reductase family protein [Kofleriaceae bacterium]